MNKKNLLAILSVIVMGILFFVINSNDNTPKDNLLVMGTHPGYAPYESIDTSGEIVGFDIDLAKALASQLGKHLVIEQAQFDSLILGLQQGKYDIIMAGMSITPDRLKEIDMVPYYGETVTEVALVFWEKIPDDNNIPKAIAVQQGTWQELFLRTMPGITVRTLEGNAELIMDLKYRKSIAALFEKHVAQTLHQKIPNLQILPIPLPPEMVIYGNGIGIEKRNKVLSQQIENAIADLKASGVMTELESKWFEEALNQL